MPVLSITRNERRQNVKFICIVLVWGGGLAEAPVEFAFCISRARIKQPRGFQWWTREENKPVQSLIMMQSSLEHGICCKCNALYCLFEMGCKDRSCNEILVFLQVQCTWLLMLFVEGGIADVMKIICFRIGSVSFVCLR